MCYIPKALLQTPINMKKEEQFDPTLYKKFEITTADVNMNSQITMGRLANLLIQSAISSADALGFGLADIQDQKLAWVLSRLNFEIYKPLMWYDIAEVETWPKNVERIFYLRDFVVRNQNKEIVAKATSAWLVIDLKSRRPKTLDENQTEDFTRLKNKHAIESPPEKLSPNCSGDELIKQATYFDIDLNQHVTATRYIDWMMDAFSIEFLQKHYPKLLTINYMKETLHNEKVSILRNQNDKEFSFEGTNQNNNMAAFRARIVF